MAFNLRNRHFLKLLDFTPQEIGFLLDLSVDLKKAKYAGLEQQRLKGKNIALIFEKSSTRTRCAFEVAAYDQGANITYLGPSGTQIGHKESIKDTARVLGRMYDGIEYRGYGQNMVEELAKYSGVPVWNGLTDEFHPTQVLADFLTMIEHCNKTLSNMKLCYLGDARNNMGNSLLVGCAIMGIDFSATAPKECWPDRRLVVLFQPHRYTRTKALLDRFPLSFNQADVLLLAPIYAAGEVPIDGVDASILYKGIKEHGHREVFHCEDRNNVLNKTLELVKPDDVILTLGAGDIYLVGNELLEEL